MFSLNPFAGTALEALFDSIVPDFVLAFTFFTALCFAVLGRQFERQRPAAAMSVALGAALAIGLVWWEQAHAVSVRDLGPIAVGFALLMLAAVIYAALHRVGGNGAGIASACGTALLIAALFGMPWPFARRIVVWAALLLLKARATNGTCNSSSPRTTAPPGSRWEIPTSARTAACRPSTKCA
jgi:hypothetical protein